MSVGEMGRLSVRGGGGSFSLIPPNNRSCSFVPGPWYLNFFCVCKCIIVP